MAAARTNRNTLLDIIHPRGWLLSG